ncbi:polysaccharide biosynthesis tyrosine autokinase [Flavisolibacter sp. BT320]|nr:polysaccharide biosynthesis tyrosine autokinase [Flavisolibacter longurius]
MEEQVILQKKVSESANFNIKELFFKYLRFLPLFAIFIGLSLLGAYIYLRYATEVYRSSGQIVIRDEKSAGSAKDDKLDMLMQSDGRKNVQTEIEILQSRPVMIRVVEGLNLNFNYFAKGRFKELNIYKIAAFRVEAIKIKDSTQGFTLNLVFPTQQSFSVNGANTIYGFGQTFQNEFGEFRLVRTSNDKINPDCKVVWNPSATQASLLSNGLVVTPKQNTGILTITMEATNPHLAADVINRLIDEYKDITIEDKNEVTLKSLSFIDATLKEREKELDSIKQAYVAYQKANNIIDPETQSSNYFTRVEDALKLEQDQRIQLNNARQLQDYLLNRENSQDLAPSSLGITDQTLNSLVEVYNKAQLERKELLANAPAGNVVVQQKTEQIEELRSKILENVRNIQSAYGGAIGTLRSTSSEAVSQIKTLPNKKQELINIQQQLASKAQIYNTLLSKREESAIALASTISNTKVLLEASPNDEPVKPNGRNVKLLAIVIGFVIPVVIIFIIELLNDKVNSRSDIEKLTDIAILGEVGHSSGDQTLIVTQGNRRFIAEQFRILRSNLQYILPHAKKPVIMVTSSFSGEGKSFISTNTGAVMALASKRTVILEFDIRKPKIISGLGLPKQRGLTNFILGQATLDELIIKVEGYENLFVLPCGPIPPNPSELLLDTRFDELFEQLREKFDVVIMDTAPVGMVSDAMTLSKYADCTLYIVRQGHTYKKQISSLEQYHKERKLPKMSIVLNDVNGQGGYGSYGAYGYGYGSGYFEDEQSTSSLNRWFGWLGAKNGSARKHNSKKKV